MCWRMTSYDLQLTILVGQMLLSRGFWRDKQNLFENILWIQNHRTHSEIPYLVAESVNPGKNWRYLMRLGLSVTLLIYFNSLGRLIVPLIPRPGILVHQ